jgi:hypothetical protein
MSLLSDRVDFRWFIETMVSVSRTSPDAQAIVDNFTPP